MPLRTITYALTADDTVEILTSRVNEQTLEALTLRLLTAVGAVNVAHCQIGIASGGVALAHRQLTLASGWLDTTSSVYWTGSLLLPVDSFLYASLIGTAGHQFQLSAILHDYIPRPIRSYVKVL